MKNIASKTKRRPYVRSKYFKSKVFTSLVVSHLLDKSPKERLRRMKLVPCAIELLEISTCVPELKIESGRKLYRFFGITKNSQKFAVHVKETSRGSKYFLSVYPLK